MLNLDSQRREKYRKNIENIGKKLFPSGVYSRIVDSMYVKLWRKMIVYLRIFNEKYR